MHRANYNIFQKLYFVDFFSVYYCIEGYITEDVIVDFGRRSKDNKNTQHEEHVDNTATLSTKLLHPRVMNSTCPTEKYFSLVLAWPKNNKLQIQKSPYSILISYQHFVKIQFAITDPWIPPTNFINKLYTTFQLVMTCNIMYLYILNFSAYIYLLISLPKFANYGTAFRVFMPMYGRQGVETLIMCCYLQIGYLCW